MSRSVLITGASSGIGATAARRLAAEDFRVYGTSRKPREQAPGDPIRWLEMDVCDDASVERATAQMRAETGRIDAVICNAGFGIFGSVEEVAIEAARAQLETNFFGVLRVLRAVLPGMREARSGRVVLVGSLAGRAPIPYQAHYSASKAAVDALALALRSELRPFGVLVSLIEPGDINTPFNEAMSWDTSPAESAYREQLEHCERVIRESLPKAPPPEVVAGAILRALNAARPRVRYAVGADSLLVPLGRRLLPDRLFRRIVEHHFGL